MGTELPQISNHETISNLGDFIRSPRRHNHIPLPRRAQWTAKACGCGHWGRILRSRPDPSPKARESEEVRGTTVFRFSLLKADD